MILLIDYTLDLPIIIKHTKPPAKAMKSSQAALAMSHKNRMERSYVKSAFLNFLDFTTIAQVRRNYITSRCYDGYIISREIFNGEEATPPRRKLLP